jgi:hypothetical protein
MRVLCEFKDKTMAPGARSRLAELSPHDRARDYRRTELRGVLSIKIRLD